MMPVKIDNFTKISARRQDGAHSVCVCVWGSESFVTALYIKRKRGKWRKKTFSGTKRSSTYPTAQTDHWGAERSKRREAHLQRCELAGRDTHQVVNTPLSGWQAWRKEQAKPSVFYQSTVSSTPEEPSRLFKCALIVWLCWIGMQHTVLISRLFKQKKTKIERKKQTKQTSRVGPFLWRTLKGSPEGKSYLPIELLLSPHWFGAPLHTLASPTVYAARQRDKLEPTCH